MEDFWNTFNYVVYGALGVMIYNLLKPRLDSRLKGFARSALTMCLTILSVLAIAYLMRIILVPDK